MICFVSGCFDLLHAGHIEFLERASQFGQLHVGVASDDTIYKLKGRWPVYSAHERRFMVGALGCVQSACISSGEGVLDFAEEMRRLRPDVLVVNEDGARPEKAALCDELGTQYRVLRRVPRSGMPPRSTTSLLSSVRVPYRIDLAGGWIDQPFVSKHHSGSVITVSIEPIMEYGPRSGLATSTRRSAASLWRQLCSLDYESLARVLFAVDNPPGKSPVSGSQDAIGIAYPGFAKSEYDGGYWPRRISHRRDHEMADFVEQYIRLVSLGPRAPGYDVLSDTRIDYDNVRALAEAAEQCWEALLSRDLSGFGSAVSGSFEAQVALFPRMVDPEIVSAIDAYRSDVYGWKLCGAGGGGYLMIVTDRDVDGGTSIRVRR